MSGSIFGIHPVLEALRSPRCRVTRVMVAEGRRDARIGKVVAAAREAGIPVQRMPAKALDRMSEGGRHQGTVALVGASGYSDPDDVLEQAGDPPLFLILDGVEDPRNLGAVIRSAAAAGVDGVFLPERGTPGLTGVCVKASAGAVERVPIARIKNVASFIKQLKDKGIWVVGLDPGGEQPWTGFDLTLPLAIVAGGEGKGIRRLALERCDARVGIPLRAGVESLNLSVAASVLLFEAVRQRTANR